MKILYTLLISMSCIPSAFSQQDSLLQKYRAMALQYNHDLRAADKNIAAGMELIKAAKADLKPKLSGDANFRYTGNPPELTPNPAQAATAPTLRGHNTNYGASLLLMQPLYTGGKIRESIRLASHQQTLSTHRSELLQASVCYQTDMQYWNTVARLELVRIASDYRSSVASLAHTLRQRVEAGLVDPQDLLMAEVKLNEADYRVLQAQSDFETGRMALNSLIGVELKAPTPVDEIVPTITLPHDLLTDHGSNRPELLMAQQQIKIAESSGKLTDAKYKPQLYMGVEGSYASPGYNFKTDLDINYAVYAKLSVPLFQWGKRRNEKRSAAWQVGIAQDELNKATDEVELEVETARTALAQALKQVALTGNSLEKAGENEQKALERYQEGKTSVMEVIEAQNYRQASQINHVQAKVAAQGSYSCLIKALHRY